MRVLAEAKGLVIGYRSKKDRKSLIAGLHFQIRESEFICLIGPNGVGKSTLLRTLAGVQEPLAGGIEIGGKPLHQLSANERARLISLVLTDKITAGSLTVKELVALGRYPFTNWAGYLSEEDMLVVENVMQMTGVAYLKEEPVYTLSDGQLQKAMIARALVQDGELLILDEPTAHLDIYNKVAVMQLLKKIAKETGKAIIMATHEMDLAIQMADTFWLFDCEKPFQKGSPEDLILLGALGAMFTQGGFGFDPMSGRFKFSFAATLHVQLHAPDPMRKWALHALEKAGIGHHDEAEAIVRWQDGKWDCILADQEIESFVDISSLVHHLNSKQRV